MGSAYSPGPDPSRPTLVAFPVLKSTTSTILSRVSTATTRPSDSSRIPLTTVKGSGNSTSGLVRVRTACAVAVPTAPALIARANPRVRRTLIVISG